MCGKKRWVAPRPNRADENCVKKKIAGWTAARVMWRGSGAAMGQHTPVAQQAALGSRECHVYYGARVVHMCIFHKNVTCFVVHGCPICVRRSRGLLFRWCTVSRRLDRNFSGIFFFSSFPALQIFNNSRHRGSEEAGRRAGAEQDGAEHLSVLFGWGVWRCAGGF